MESELIKTARSAGQNFLEDKCLGRFESLVGREEHSTEAKALTDNLIPGIIYLFDMGLVESGILYETAARYFRKYPLRFPEEKVEGGFIDSILADEIEMGFHDVCVRENEILEIHNLIPAVSRILLCERMEMTQYYDDRDSLYKLLLSTMDQSEFKYSNDDRIDPKNAEEVGFYYIYRRDLLLDFLRRCWLVWQISYSKKAQADSEIASQIQNLIDMLKTLHAYEFTVSDLPDWTIGAILITICNLREKSKYINLIDDLKVEIQKRWNNPGYCEKATLIGTALVIAGLNLSSRNRIPLVSMMQKWLAEEQIGKRKGDSGYWKQDIVSIPDGECSRIWSTVLILRALDEPSVEESVEPAAVQKTDALSKLSKNEAEENRKCKFKNKWHIQFNADNSILFDGKRIKFPLKEFKLLLRLAYQLFIRLDQLGWIKIYNSKQDNIDLSIEEDDPEATLMQLGYLDLNEPEITFTALRKHFPEPPEFPIDSFDLIQTEKGRTKRRRLSSHPRLLSFDWDGLLAHSDERIRELVGKIYQHKNKTFEYSEVQK